MNPNVVSCEHEENYEIICKINKIQKISRLRRYQETSELWKIQCWLIVAENCLNYKIKLSCLTVQRTFFCRQAIASLVSCKFSTSKSSIVDVNLSSWHICALCTQFFDTLLSRNCGLFNSTCLFSTNCVLTCELDRLEAKKLTKVASHRTSTWAYRTIDELCTKMNFCHLRLTLTLIFESN